MQNNTPPSDVGGGEKVSHTPALKHHQRAALILGARGLSATQKAILHAISHRTNRAGEAWPGQSLLAAEAGLSVRGLRKALPKLAHVLESDTEQRRSTTYRIRWDVLVSMAQTPEQSSALNTDSEEQSSHDPEQSSAPPRNSVPPTPEQSSPERYKNGSEERSKNGTPHSPPKGEPVDNSDEAVDKSTETTTTPQKPSKAPKKRTRKPDCLSVAEVIAVEIPAELASVEGYAEGFRQWCEVRPGKGWRQKPIQVERFHAKMLKAHRAGLDVIRGLNDAFDKGWKGISPSYLKPLEARPAVSGHASQTAEADTAWENVRAAMAHWGRRPPGQDWGFSDDPAEDRRYLAAIKGATYRDDTREAWAHLYNNIGHHERGPKLKRSFGYHWRTARRAEVAA